MNINNISPNNHSIARLKWACRRGMLELDVLLGDFLDSAYCDLDDKDKSLFISLLDSPDPDLFAWLMGKTQPEDASLIKIVDMIRKHAKQSV